MGNRTNEPLGELREDGTLVFERSLPGPIERVWDYVIDGDKRALWLAGGDMPLIPGIVGRMVFDHQALASDQPPEKYGTFGKPMVMDYEVLACTPPRHVRFTWPDLGPVDPDGVISIVDIDLKPDGDKVILRLTHSCNATGRDNLIELLGGWDTHLGLLIDRIEGRPVRPFWANQTASEALYAEHYTAVFDALAKAT